MLRTFRKYLVLLLTFLVAGYLVFKFRHAITLEGFRWSMVVESLRDARISLLLLGVAAIYVCFAIRALRWMRFSRRLGQAHFGNVYNATLMGFACTFLLGRAAEPIRPVLIAKKDSLSMPGMFGVYVLERVFDLSASALLAGFALLSFKRKGFTGQGNLELMEAARSAGVLLLVGLVATIVFLIYFRYHGAGKLARKLREPSWRQGWRGRLVLLIEGFSEGLQSIRTWGDLGALTIYTAAHWLLIAFVYLWVIHAFPGQLAGFSFAAATLVLAVSMLGSALQLPGVGGGMQLASFLVFTLIFGVEKEPAATASIMLWLVTFASCSLAGLPLLFWEGWSMGELRRMAHAEGHSGEAALLAETKHAALSSADSSTQGNARLP
jgi:uncharacterized membrane protein YbhN (UPF0104 family)